VGWGCHNVGAELIDPVLVAAILGKGNADGLESEDCCLWFAFEARDCALGGQLEVSPSASEALPGQHGILLLSSPVRSCAGLAPGRADFSLEAPGRSPGDARSEFAVSVSE